MADDDNIPQQAGSQAQRGFDPPATLQPGAFTLSANESKNVQQASETFTMRAAEGQILGSKGETLAFAKPQFDPGQFQALTQQKTELAAQIEDLEKNSQVLKNWKTLDAEIQSVPGRLASAEKELLKSQTKLAEVEVSGTEQQKQDWRGNVVGDQAHLQTIRALDAQLPQSRVQLEQLAAAPEVVAYHELVEARTQTDARLAPIATIAETSSPLYNNQRERQAQADMGGDRALLARSVASYKVDQLLGTGVIAEEKMAEVAGNRLMGVSVQVDGAQITGKYQGKDCYLQADYTDPRIQKGMADLEAMDYITGQIDRHHGNVFVDPSSGKVTGIDNDLCFPERDREVMLRADGALREKAVVGLPLQMSEDMAKKILAVSPEMLTRELSGITNPGGGGGLSTDEIQGAVTRLQNLQEAIKSPDSGLQIVKEFDGDSYQAAVLHQKAIYAANTVDADVNLQQPNFQDVDHVRSLMGVPKASYLGAAVMQGRSYELNEGIIVDEVEFGLRDPDTAGIKAAAVPEFAAYKAEEQRAKQVMRENPSLIEDFASRKEALQLKAQTQGLQAKLDGYQHQLDKLDHAGLADRARALVTHGGVDRSKAFFQDKQMAALQEMKALQQQMDTIVEKAIVPMRNELYMTAQDKLENRAMAAPVVGASGNPRLNQIRSIATENGVNLKMVELEGPNGEAQAPNAMRQIAANKEINAETWRERGNRMVEKDSPAEAKLAFIKADREEALAGNIRKAAALLDEGDGKLGAGQIDALHQDFSAVYDVTQKHDIEEAVQNEQRMALYEQEVEQTLTPVLQDQGFTPAEIRTFTEAAVKLGIESESAALMNRPEVAQMFAEDLKKGLETSNFKYSGHNESASKLHDALYKAYNTSPHVHIDGQTEIKRGHASFQENRANDILREVANANGVELPPANALQAAQIAPLPPASRVSVGAASGLQRDASSPSLADQEPRLDGPGSGQDVRASLGAGRSRSNSGADTPELNDPDAKSAKQTVGNVAKLKAQFEAAAKDQLKQSAGADPAKAGGGSTRL